MKKWLFILVATVVGVFATAHVNAQGTGTINQLSPFQVASGTVRLASTTALFRIPSLVSVPCIGTSANGTLQAGTCTGGGGSGGGFPIFIQNGGGTLNVATTTLNFLTNSFVLVENPDDTFSIRVSTTTLGLLTTNVAEGSNLYYTDTRARNAISETVPGLTYTSSTGVLSLDGGFTIPTTTLLSDLSNFFITPSSRITAGSGLQWSTNTLNCVTATGSVFGCLTAADWTIFNQKVSSTSIDTSAELRSLVTDETGTGALMFGITSAMSDDISCGPSQVLARNSGDSAWECVPMTVGGGGGGIATTTDNNAEIGETISFLNTDLYIGGSASNTAEFNFDKDAARFTLSSTTANATATITGLGGGVRLASPTENVEFNLNLADTLRLFSGTGVSAFDFGALRASGTALTFTNATNTTFTTNALRILGLADGCLNVTGGAVGSTGVACGSGSGGGGTISTSTTPVIGQMAYWTGLNTLGTIATGSLTDSVPGLTLSATRSLIGGAADLSLDSGFVIPTTTRAAIWDTAISDGNTGWDNIYGLITANTATLTVTNATTTNATTTNLRFTNATGVNATTTNLGISVMHGLSSAGIIFLANSGTQVADFGAGGGSNATFNGGVTINGQATIPILLGTNATITNATSTSLFSTIGRFTTASTTFASSTSLTTSILRVPSLSDGCLNVTGGLVGSTGVACGSGGGGGGTTLATTSFDYIITTNGTTVFAWNASTTATEFSGDFSTVLQNVVNKLDGSNQGGRVYIFPGRYVSTATTTIQGPGAVTAFTNTVTIQGAGQGATEVIVTGSTDFLHLTDVAVANITDMTVYLGANGRGITSRGPAGGVRAFWLSTFKNLVFTATGTHTGVAMYLGNPFRSHFENIEFYEVGSCAHFRAEDTTAAFSAYNPGDFTFYRSFCDMNNTTAETGFTFSSAGNYARINQASFDMVEIYGADVGDTAIDFGGQASHNIFTNANIENVGTVMRVRSNTGVVKARNNEVTTNYIYVFTGGTVADFDANSQNNELDIGEWYNDGTVTLVKDANTDVNQRNIIKRLGLNNDGTILITNPATSTTIIRDVYGRNDGFSNATNTIRFGNFSVPGFFGIGSTTPSRALTVIGDGWLSGLLTTGSLVTTNATSTTLGVTSSLSLFGSTAVTSNNALCIQLTGSADLCDGVDGGGGGSSKWTDAGLFTYLTDTADDVVIGSTNTTVSPFWFRPAGRELRLGWGSADIATTTITLGSSATSSYSMGYNGSVNGGAFVIASSTSVSTNTLMRVFSTTTLAGVATSSNQRNIGGRVEIGTNNRLFRDSGTMGSLHVNGIFESEYNLYICEAELVPVAPTVNNAFCKDAVYFEDGTAGTGALSTVAFGPYTHRTITLANSTAAGGAGLFFNPNAAVMPFGTSSPMITSMIALLPGSTSTVNFGYFGVQPAGNALELPGVAVQFFASSTRGLNWFFTVRESHAASTTIDTGVASNTPVMLRIQARNNAVAAWIATADQPWRMVFIGTVNETIRTANFTTGVYMARDVGGRAGADVHVIYMDLYKRKPLYWFNY